MEDDYSFDVEKAANLFSALPNVTRLKMLRLIAEGETDITTIVASLEVGQSALSQHLTKLRAMKLVKTSRAPVCLVFCYARVEADRRRLERIT